MDKTRPRLNTIGNRIKHYRKQAGMTQVQVCTKLGWDISMLSHYEGDRRRPRVDKLFDLATLFNIKVSNLIP